MDANRNTTAMKVERKGKGGKWLSLWLVKSTNAPQSSSWATSIVLKKEITEVKTLKKKRRHKLITIGVSHSGLKSFRITSPLKKMYFCIVEVTYWDYLKLSKVIRVWIIMNQLSIPIFQLEAINFTINILKKCSKHLSLNVEMTVKAINFSIMYILEQFKPLKSWLSNR